MAAIVTRPAGEWLWEVDAKEDVSSTDYLSAPKIRTVPPPKISTVPPSSLPNSTGPRSLPRHSDRTSTIFHNENSQNELQRKPQILIPISARKSENEHQNAYPFLLHASVERARMHAFSPDQATNRCESKKYLSDRSQPSTVPRVEMAVPCRCV